jgi:integrase
MTRRARGEGSLYRRESDGKWVGAVTDEDGKRRVVYGETQREARDKLRALVHAVESGLPVTPERLTVGAYLDEWCSVTLPDRVRAGRLAPSTLDSYRDICERHIIPAIGGVKLSKLTPARVRAWVGTKLSETSNRGRPLSARTVAYCHAVLRKSLNDALRDELVPKNVAALVEPPAQRREPVEPLSADEARQLLAAGAEHRLRTLWLVLLSLGLRRGEALALRWEDVDLDVGTVTIQRSLQRVRTNERTPSGRRRGELREVAPKTSSSAATIALPDSLVAALREHRKTQAAERLAAVAWVDPGLVFTTHVGTALEPRNVNRAWEHLCTRAGVRRVRLHDLRHSAATFMLAAGADLKVIQATLRHSRLSTTSDVYAHVLADVQRQAAERMDGVLRQLSGD